MAATGSVPSISALTSTPSAATQLPNSSNATLGPNAFLQLLTTELQNQDPTQPVDPTAMVGQMISLNELDQLISINQILSGLGTAPPTGSSTSKQPATASSSSGAQVSGVARPVGTAAEPLALQSIEPYNGSPVTGPPGSFYNLYGNIGAAATSFNHINAFGGK